MKKPKIFVTGAGGRMGQEVVGAAKASGEWVLGGGYDRAASGSTTSDLSKVTSGSLDVIIDFSAPSALKDILNFAVKANKPVVSGTTGLGPKEFDLMKAASKKIALLWAPNMSIGVAMFETLIHSVANLKDFDFQIEEFHHRHKKDRPSGTAILLQKALEKATQKKQPEPLSIRGGGIFGIHRLYCMSPDETISIEHAALNRTVFAKGALLAARWLIQQPAGLYSLRDTLTK